MAKLYYTYRDPNTYPAYTNCWVCTCGRNNADYIRTARAKGLRERVVHYKHALKNTLSLVATLIGAAVGEFLGGSTVIERVFNIQGLGKLAHSSMMRLDYYQTQAIILFSMLIYIVINIILDIVYKMLDPRIEY